MVARGYHGAERKEVELGTLCNLLVTSSAITFPLLNSEPAITFSSLPIPPCGAFKICHSSPVGCIHLHVEGVVALLQPPIRNNDAVRYIY